MSDTIQPILATGPDGGYADAVRDLRDAIFRGLAQEYSFAEVQPDIVVDARPACGPSPLVRASHWFCLLDTMQKLSGVMRVCQ